MLALKIVLAPGLVVVASLVERRFGSRVGGLFAALPIVAGPILLFYAKEQGVGFAAGAAASTLLGLVSLTAFVVVYASFAGRVGYAVALASGWGAFLVSTALLSTLRVPPVAALIIAVAAFSIALLVLPRFPATEDSQVIRRPSWDLPLRAGAALALVLVLTFAASSLGPRLGGLLTPFPVVASVLAAFTHVQGGNAAVQQLLRGLVVGFFAFALFCFVLAIALRPDGILVAFAFAAVAALSLQAVVLRVSHGRAMAVESNTPLP